MSTRDFHGTECFEIEAFLYRNEVSKLFKVRHKITGRRYRMEVVPREKHFPGPTSSKVQETRDGLSKFWVNLEFTFQTNSKFYYILEYIGETTLGSVYENNCPLSEEVIIFYTSEIVIALEELHSYGLLYGELDLEKVLLDNTGHVVLWRNFSGKKYWTRQECVCNMTGFTRGNPCGNTHVKISEREIKIDFQMLGLIILQLFSHDKLTSLLNNKASKQERILRLASKSDFLPSTLSVFARDLVTRLLRGQFFNSQHVKSHPFFTGVNWKMVKGRLTTPPGITRKISHPPRLRKSSSETCIRPQSPVSVNEDYLSPPYQVRPASTPLNYPNTRVQHGDFTDESLGSSYPQYSPQSAPRILRSTLSSPDLSLFGQDTDDCQWTRERHSHHAEHSRSYPDKYAYNQFSPIRSSNRYGLSHSMSDLSNIDRYDVYEAPLHMCGRPRTSSLTDTTGGQNDSYSPRGLVTRYSFPPSNVDYMQGLSMRNRTTDDYDYSYSYGGSCRLPGNSFDGRQCDTRYMDSRQQHNQPNKSYNGPVPYIYRTENYTKDFGRYSHNNDFHFGSYDSHHDSSISDLRSINSVQGSIASSPRESYSRTSDIYIENSRESFGSGFSTLQRSRSCSDLNASDNEESKENTQNRSMAASKAIERRKNHPLAKIPIPSFEEFKRRNSTQSVDGDLSNSSRGRNENFLPTKEKQEHPNEEKQEHGHCIEKKTTTKDKIRSTAFLTSRYSSKERRGSRDASKSRSDPSGSARERSSEKFQESYYSQNDVIHNLMLKYGLYERGERKREAKDSVSKEEEIMSTKTESTSKNKKDLGTSLESDIQATVKIPEVNNHTEIDSNARGARNGRRRASAVLHRDAPKLTHKSYSSLSPSTALQLSAENSSFGGETIDPNNNLKINGDEDEEDRKSRAKKDGFQFKNLDTTTRGRQDISIADVYKTTRLRKSLTPESLESVGAQNISLDDRDSGDSVTKETGGKTTGSQKTSKTLWAAAKDKLKIKKSPNSSPFLKRKEKEDVKNKNERNFEEEEEKSEKPSSSLSTEEPVDMANSSKQETSRKEINRLKFARNFAKEDNTKRKLSTDSSSQGQLRRSGIHSSLLSITSSLYSTDIDLDDSGSWHSELDTSKSSRSGSRKRWESFHSNVSADSGSAHMYEFETDSIAAEMEDEFQEQETTENRKKSDVEVERTDSGIGGDIGLDHNYKRSWEDIVLKSSKHWSVVAASARHWQDLAKKSKKSKEITGKKMKSIAPAITEDMVECVDCQKFFVPQDKSGQELAKDSPTHSVDLSICTKCRENRVERKEAIIELVQTEINYGNDLQILKEEFYSPLQSGGILQPDNLAEIFLNLQELVEVSTRFSRRLQNGLEVSVSNGNEEFSQVNVGGIFLESVELFQSYEIYCSKQIRLSYDLKSYADLGGCYLPTKNSASALLESLQKKNELLKIFLNVTCRENPKCRKMDLNSFLLAPVQRIMKYPLLLSRIRKATPRRNQDREKLMQAQKKVEDQLNRINALNSTVEPKQRRYRGSGHLGRSDSLDKLQMKKMASEILNWTLGELHLLMHGIFEVVIHEFASSGGWNRRGGKRSVDVFMLFCIRGLSEPRTIDSDEDNALEEPFFPSDSEATDAVLVMLRKKINGKYTLFKEPLSLDTCVVCKDSEHKDSFEIINMSRETYVFKATGNKESKKWLKHLRLQAKDLGMWKKRRNGLPNIMIKNI